MTALRAVATIPGTVRALLSRRTAITPRWCPQHGQTIRTISEQQRQAALKTKRVTCTCGEYLAPAEAVGL